MSPEDIDATGKTEEEIQEIHSAIQVWNSKKEAHDAEFDSSRAQAYIDGFDGELTERTEDVVHEIEVPVVEQVIEENDVEVGA